MTDRVFKEYDAFYNMVLSTTIMSNSQTVEFKSDAEKIIRFIGDAYRLPSDFVEECKDIILEDLISLGLTTDQQAIYSSRGFTDTTTEKDVLFDIKGDVLAKLHSLSQLANGDINLSWFDYSHYKTYQADVRYAKINIASATGNVITTRQVGILSALGIGCNINLEESTKRLTQCAFWGDIPSMYLLAYVYSLCGNEEKSSLFYELTELSKKYLLSGYTVLPEKEKATYSEEARTYYIYISTIKQDIVHAYNKNNIDFSFIEAITSDSLDYFQRMKYINNYHQNEWKNVTNSSERPSTTTKFGFN